MKPVGKTQQMLEEENVFAKDKLIQEKYLIPIFNFYFYRIDVLYLNKMPRIGKKREF